MWWSCALLGFIAFAYFFKPDGLAAVTVWPIWTWAVLGILPMVFKFSRKRLVVLLLWVVAWFSLSDDGAAFARQLAAPQAHDLRVVTLNCAGSLEAGKEVIALEPDVILFQESMGSHHIEELRKLLGDEWQMAVGVDASILAKGELREVVVSHPKPTNFTMAWLGDTLIVSLRLNPAALRFDYWNPDCWREYNENKKRRRLELSHILEVAAMHAGGAPIIIGGDFNTPPDHTLTDRLDELADDSFSRAGRGYGATAVSGFPLVRIDQIWASPEYLPVNAYGVTSKHSDHRAFVADFRKETTEVHQR